MSNTSKKSIDLTPQPHLTVSAHEDSVCGIAYLPDGRLVTCSDDETVRIWDLENGEQEGMAMEHGGGVAGWVRGLAVTRDGKRILSGGSDNLLRVWDVETQQPIAEWGGHEDTVHCIVVSPDDQLIASGDGEGRIVIREMKEGQTKHVIETVPGDVSSICFSPDGTKLASAHDDEMIRVFDVENGNLIVGPIQGHTNFANSVVWSLDGSRLFTASDDCSIRLWDSETGEAIGDPWTGHTRYVNSISLSPDGTKLASVSGDATVRFWGTESGEPIGEPLQHGNDVWVVIFSPSGEFVACGEKYGKVSIWRVSWWDDRNIEVHKSLLDRPAITTARVLDHQFDYLDLPTNRRPSPPRTRPRDIHATEDPSRTQGSVLSWRLWRTLPRLLFGRSHGSPRHAELTTIYPGFATQPHLTISAHENRVCGIAYLPDGRLVTRSGDETVRIWNLENGEQEGMTMEHGGDAGWLRGLAATGDGKRILSGGPDGVLRVWDVETHQPIAEWGGHEFGILCIVVSPDNQLVASGGEEGRIVIREMKEEGQMKHVIETVPGDVNSICFSPDGTKLASAHDDNNIRVFDVENGNLIVGPIQGHTDWVSSVVWSLDGNRLFTVSADQTIRLWDSETGEAIGGPWTGHINYINSISLSPDGTKLASASSDDTVCFWGTESGEPIGEPLQHGNDVWHAVVGTEKYRYGVFRGGTTGILR
ncbi:WD40 repeat-like protein [Paxillus ammoniavirescens]|nr:WD40 repeat-like protein [Paxillus ammoniavirescens]